MKLSEIQQYVANFSKEKGFADTTIEKRTMYLMAELGELTEAVLRRNDDNIKREIGLEMFDVIWNVCDLANKLEIDLEEAFQEKMEINRDRKW
ncbi:pyrophosphatase [Bacillus pseudomycoides]|uniref:MazG nucleotide pyrophosphohydrolase domain-containing protein n=1 Tax=Bacillus pseudomycoides TaxID=64104 RepID=UPI000BF52C62|nr:MazG nucleotide pyrophosphohydrolase domain-containing protein [Bacillus pseudomycoides]PFZ02487.1 pyrophosphatase [Bacillus pseudomycoides]